MDLYQENDYGKTKRTLSIRFAIEGVMLAVFIALLTLFVTAWRNVYLAMLSCGLGGALLTFYFSTMVMPWFRYWRYQVDIQRGRAHDLDCRFVSVSEGERISDGVAFHDFIVSIDGEQSDERLLFWDADKAMPPLKVGQPLHIRSFGNYIIALDAK